jgi:hypothetical protein
MADKRVLNRYVLAVFIPHALASGAHRNNYANTRGILIYGHFSSLIDGFSSNPNIIGLFSLG